MNDKATIQELIEDFDFPSLTENQKEMVLSEITENEYQDLRETIKMTVDYFENEPKLLADDFLKPVVKKENLFLRLITYNVPIYKVAAAAILIVALNFIFTSMLNNGVVEIVEQVDDVESGEDSFAEFQKFSSNNSIKYNRGFARLY